MDITENLFIVRPVTLDDVPAMIELYNADELLANPIVSQHERTEFLLRIEEYRLQKIPLFADCTASGKMIAWGGYMPVPSRWDTSRTVEMFLYPNRNIGARLIKAIVATARQNKKHTVIARLSARDVNGNVDIYRSLGFRQAGYIRQAIDVLPPQQRIRAASLARGIDCPEPTVFWIGIFEYQLMLNTDESAPFVKQVYVLPGKRITSNESFGAVIGEVINGPEGYFGDGDLDAFIGCLRGGCGTPDEPYTIVWLDSAVSRAAMSYEYTVRALEAGFPHVLPSYRPGTLEMIEQARRREGMTEFDKIVYVIQEAACPELILL